MFCFNNASLYVPDWSVSLRIPVRDNQEEFIAFGA